jgi:hypothetical protein
MVHTSTVGPLKGSEIACATTICPMKANETCQSVTLPVPPSRSLACVHHNHPSPSNPLKSAPSECLRHEVVADGQFIAAWAVFIIA